MITGKRTWGGATLTVMAAMMVVGLAGGGWAQKPSAFGTDITVCKTPTPPPPDWVGCMYSVVQEAVNNAQEGQVIEILDEEVYNEQVTIDGREVSPWDGKNGLPTTKVVGGKNGITIRYVPVSNATAAFSPHKRPTILYKDITNTWPKNKTDAENPGELANTSGNFETCGALRVIRATGVKIEGIAVDGGGKAPFGNAGVWGGQWPLTHGNAAITLVVSGQATIRDCDIKNAYIGINIKDRNVGGVFGNPNPNDNDVKNIVPLSGFGDGGSHFIEYNRVDSNLMGMFIESAWDLGSTIRYNLFYHNQYSKTLMDKIAGKDDVAGGGIVFKDNYITPMAIYNNTFYENSGNILGLWKTGAQHLPFNNIFSKAIGGGQTAGNEGNPNDNYILDSRFPYRMLNSVFSAEQVTAENRNMPLCRDESQQIYNQEVRGITQVRINNSWPQPARAAMTVNCVGVLASMTVTTNEFIPQGAVISGGELGIPASANLRWLEMTAGTAQGTRDLFMTTAPGSIDFLKPKYTTEPLVQDLIMNKGWGMTTSDGKVADIGAQPSSGGRQTTIARIIPTNVVILNANGSSGTANFMLKVENNRTFNNPKIKVLRWIAPLPDTTNIEDNNKKAVPAASIHNVPVAGIAGVKVGGNSTTFNTGVTYTAATLPEFGFFEIIIEGTDAAGNVVTSDVGFLPYRALQYGLDITLKDGNTVVTTVDAGKAYTMTVTAVDLKSGAPYTRTLNDVEYKLLSDAAAFMWLPNGTQLIKHSGSPFTGPQTYTVEFRKAGDETIMGTGRYIDGDRNLVFIGTLDIVVNPGEPDRVTFVSPIPKSQLAGGPAPIINRGQNYPVLVEVQDKFGNAVAPKTTSNYTVSIVSNDPAIGTVSAATMAYIDSLDMKGYRVFATVSQGALLGQEFDLTATLSVNGKTDVGRLRVGRSLARLELFYSDTATAGVSQDAWSTYQDRSVEISVSAGEWQKVTVKAVEPDKILVDKNGQVSIEPGHAAMLISSTPDGATLTNVVTMTAGVAVFYVSAGPTLTTDVASYVNVTYMVGGSVDNSVMPGDRDKINLVVPSSSIVRAVLYGDGDGRPTIARVYFNDAQGGDGFKGTALPKPSAISIRWPQGSGVVVETSDITVEDSYVLSVDFTGLKNAAGQGLPEGFTSMTNSGRFALRVHGGVAGVGVVDSLFPVTDSIGPVIADEGRGASGVQSPQIKENTKMGVDADTLWLQVSEPIYDEGALIGANTMLFIESAVAPPSPAVGGEAMEVTNAVIDGGFGGYKLTVKAMANGPKGGDWIRFNPAGGLKDVLNNEPGTGPHVANRWVQLVERSSPPVVESAWYTTNVTSTGRLDYAYIAFDKRVYLSWFRNGAFTFGSDKTVVGEAQNFLSIEPDNLNVLRVDLAVAYPSSQRDVHKSGDVVAKIDFDPTLGPGWADGLPYVAIGDKAKPVIADTVILRFGAVVDDGSGSVNPDTLIVDYNEALSSASMAVARPVTILVREGGVVTPYTPTLRAISPVATLSPRKGFSRVTYVVENLGCEPSTGDMVRIDGAAGIADTTTRWANNVQDVPDNLQQPLKIDRKVKWAVKVKNNPFRGGEGSAVISLSPGLRGSETAEIESHILIYDNLGSVVVDAKVKPTAANPREIEFVWDGHNKKGRLVGTGAYLMRAVSTAKIGEDTHKDDVRKPIGVVRK